MSIKKWQNLSEYAVILAFRAIIRLLPQRPALWCGKALGLLIYSFIPIRREVARDNVSRAFPSKSAAEVEKILRRSYITFALNLVEFIRLPDMTPGFLARIVRFDRPEIMAECHAKGIGTICLSGHFGNWELMAAAISALGYPMTALAREQRNPQVNEMIRENRRRAGIETLGLSMALRNILRALRRNNFVALLTDQDAHDEGIFVDFLGRPSSTAAGPALFALKTKAPIIFGSAVRGPHGRHVVHLELIDHSDLEGATPENIRTLTQRHARVLEQSVRRWPDHWFWMHKRWKTAPRS